jgi:pyridoxine 5'-phosphate synthase PdxJ
MPDDQERNSPQQSIISREEIETMHAPIQPEIRRQTLADQIENFTRDWNPQSAEYYLVQTLFHQLRHGAERIDLSLQYSTPSALVAAQRHEEAIQSISPFLAEARNIGVEVSSGHALTTEKTEQYVKTPERDRSMGIFV